MNVQNKSQERVLNTLKFKKEPCTLHKLVTSFFLCLSASLIVLHRKV